MKNSFNLWKTWIVVSAIVGSLMIGWVLYAASKWALTTDSNFASWRTDAMLGNVLEAGDWNTLMTKLSLIWWVPSWAVMAFDATKCPEGWEEFTAAADKYIRWAAYAASDLRDVGGHTTIQLTVDQMPSHYHFIARNGGSYYWDAQRFCGELPSGYAQSNYLDTYNRCDNNYDLAFHHPSNDYSYNQPDVWRTNTVWKWQSVDVMDPYIKLLYCKKK